MTLAQPQISNFISQYSNQPTSRAPVQNKVQGLSFNPHGNPLILSNRLTALWAMLPARHALTSHLLVKTSRRTRLNLYSSRSAIISDNERHPRHASAEETRRRRGFGRISLGSFPTNLSSWQTKSLPSDKRKRLIDRNNFIPWLTQHLKALVQQSEDSGVSQSPEEKGFATFLRNLIPVLKSDSTWFALGSSENKTSNEPIWQPTEQSRPLALFKALREAFLANGQSGVDAQLKYSFNGLLAGRAFSKMDLDDQTQLADLRYPMEWYPATRQVQRTIHMHVGPTNSGKTYHALKRLEQAHSGVYAGPLRLLAHEVYTRLNAQGKVCDLITGDEQRLADTANGPKMKSCTVEMVPLNVDVDVAVIDEIQMIGDANRGWAWTQALLGLKAKELHLCGEERTVPLIREMAASMGDKLEVHTYKRLSPLKVMSTSLQGDLRNLRKGDCLVVFSRVGIHSMKTQIEKATEKRVAIVYGSLPPEVRAQQAALFNDPNNDYDILVASDAIGMGLNLAIKRIVFETITKYNGAYFDTIQASQIKQIAGRAGRFRTAVQAPAPVKANVNSRGPTAGALLDLPAPPSHIGLVTTMEEAELPIVRNAMQVEPEPIMTAGLYPPTTMLEKFAMYFPPSTSFSYIMIRLHELSTLHPRYHLCDLRQQTGIADIIQPVRGLTIHDRILFCASPAEVKDPGMPAVVAAYARCVAENFSGELLSIPEIPLEVLDEEVRLDREYMRRLESLHKALILYLWLSYRFTGVFVDQDLAFYVKKLTEEKIDAILADFSASPAVRKQIQAMKREALLRLQKMNEMERNPDTPARACGIADDPSAHERSSDPVGEKDVDAEHQGPAFQIPEVEPELEDEGLAVGANVSRP